MDKDGFIRTNNAIDLALSLIDEGGCDDVFRPPKFLIPIEMKLIADNKDEFRRLARSSTIDFINKKKIKEITPLQKTFILKDHVNFRQISWIDPFDYVKYLTLALCFFPIIEAARIEKKHNVVHSARKSDNSNEVFDRQFDFSSFRKTSGVLTKLFAGQWKIVADISNFFDRINLHSLQNHLWSVGCDTDHVELLNSLLTHWTGSQRSFGIPVGSDASRIISEAIFINTDKRLRDAGVRFVRYVDDFRIFAETREKAYSHLLLLTQLLAEEGLFLNSQKTRLCQIGDTDEDLIDQQDHRGSEHEVIDIERKEEVRIFLAGSGRAKISTFYREPGKEALKALRKLDKSVLVREIRDQESDFEYEKLVKQATKFFIYVDQDVDILKSLIDKRMSSLIYITDALKKEQDKLSKAKIGEIRKLIFENFIWDDCPYPYKLPLLRLGTVSGFEDSNFVQKQIEKHGLMGDIHFLREAILLTYPQFDRAFLRTLCDSLFRNVPDLLKRAIFFALKNSSKMLDEEKKPLLKNLANSTNDWFVQKLYDSAQF